MEAVGCGKGVHLVLFLNSHDSKAIITQAKTKINIIHQKQGGRGKWQTKEKAGIASSGLAE